MDRKETQARAAVREFLEALVTTGLFNEENKNYFEQAALYNAIVNPRNELGFWEYDEERAATVFCLEGHKPNGRAALKALTQEFIDSGVPLPVTLRRFILGEAIKKNRPIKRGTPSTPMRASMIIVAVIIARQHGFRPQRSPGHQDQPCGCSMVADILAECGSPYLLAESGVEYIWKTYHKSVDQTSSPMK